MNQLDFYQQYIDNFSSNFDVSGDKLFSGLYTRIEKSDECIFCSIGAPTNLANVLSRTSKIKKIISMSMSLPRPDKFLNTNVRLDPRAEEFVMRWVKDHPECSYIVIPSHLLDQRCEWYQRDLINKNKITFRPEIESFLKKKSWRPKWMTNSQYKNFEFIQKNLWVDWSNDNPHQKFWIGNSSKVNDPITIMVALSIFTENDNFCPVILRQVSSISCNLSKSDCSKYMILGEIIFDEKDENSSKTYSKRVLNEELSDIYRGIEFIDLDYNKNKNFYMADEIIEEQGTLKWLLLFNKFSEKHNWVNYLFSGLIFLNFYILASIFRYIF